MPTFNLTQSLKPHFQIVISIYFPIFFSWYYTVLKDRLDISSTSASGEKFGGFTFFSLDIVTITVTSVPTENRKKRKIGKSFPFNEDVQKSSDQIRTLNLLLYKGLLFVLPVAYIILPIRIL